MILNTENLLDTVEESSYYWQGEPKLIPSQHKPDINKPLAVDLFCGMGGLSLGFEEAGFEILLGVDIHIPSIKTYARAHPRSACILGDIRKTLSSTVKHENSMLYKIISSIIENKELDVLMAGIPCQGFSLANKKRHPLDSRNHLFRYFLEAVKTLKPKCVVIENVEAIKRFNNGSFTNAIVCALKQEGYKTECNVLNAADYGVPQTRKRMIFIGLKNGRDLIWPANLFGTNLKPYRTVFDAISDLPHVNAGESTSSYINKPKTEYQALMRKNSKSLFNHKAPKHPKETIERIEKTLPGMPMYDSYTQRIRLSWEKPSPTQVSGGIRPQFQFGHPEQPRGLTIRERCRIQSIPDHVYIEGQVVQGRVQTGNVVPPLLANAIAKYIKIALNKELFQEKLLTWGMSYKREFPWNNMHECLYKALITEMLLRKTRAENLSAVYHDIMSLIPTIDALHKVEETELESALTPIGLSKTRVKAFKSLANVIASKHNNEIPDNIEALMSLPHVGRYTANATLLFHYDKKYPIVDINVARIVSRVFGINAALEIHKDEHLWEVVEYLFPDTQARDFGKCLLDFGAAVCKAKNPKCNSCIMGSMCTSRSK